MVRKLGSALLGDFLSCSGSLGNDFSKKKDFTALKYAIVRTLSSYNVSLKIAQDAPFNGRAKVYHQFSLLPQLSAGIYMVTFSPEWQDMPTEVGREARIPTLERRKENGLQACDVMTAAGMRIDEFGDEAVWGQRICSFRPRPYVFAGGKEVADMARTALAK